MNTSYDLVILGQLESLKRGLVPFSGDKDEEGEDDKNEKDDEDGKEGDDEDDVVAIEGLQAKQLMDQIRKDVQEELQGFRRGTQLIDATDFDIDGRPWEAGVQPPKSPTKLPKTSETSFMADAGDAGNTVVLPRQAPVEEMVSVLRIRMKAMFKGGPNEAAGKLWDAIVGEIEDIDEEKGGIEFSVFPRALKDSVGIEIRSQLSAATLFRFLDHDDDNVICKSDMIKALARALELEKSTLKMLEETGEEVVEEPSSRAGHGKTMRHIVADRFLVAVCESMDRQQMTVRMAFTALASQTLKGKKKASDPKLFGTVTITKDMYVAFIRGMCPRELGKEDAESVLLYIDRNDDDKIGWDEFMESFVACYGRWLMRLKQTVARLADKVSNPAMKERYSTEVAKVNNVQRMMAAAFRQTKRTLAQQQEQESLSFLKAKGTRAEVKKQSK